MTERRSFPGFESCIELIRSDDPMTFEDGFHLLLPKVKNYGDKLVEVIEKEVNPRLKSRFVELLGECEDPRYIPVFEKLLSSDSHDVVAWALTSLEKLSEGKEIASRFRSQNTKWLD